MTDCVKCGDEIKGRRHGAAYCSEQCRVRAAQVRHYLRHRARLAADRSRVNSNAPKRILARAKSRAKIAGIGFNLTLEDIQIPSTCPVLGIPISPNHGRKGYFPDSPSLDRIIPALGYTKGNVRVISHRANLLKSNATVEELKAVLSDLERLLAHI